MPPLRYQGNMENGEEKIGQEKMSEEMCSTRSREEEKRLQQGVSSVEALRRN